VVIHDDYPQGHPWGDVQRALGWPVHGSSLRTGELVVMILGPLFVGGNST